MSFVATLCLFCTLLVVTQAEMPPQCSIYCVGEVLQAIQSAKIFKDCKDFVDMPLTADPETILQAFNNLPDKTPASLRIFLTTHFYAPDQSWVPHDWTPNPPFAKNITDSDLNKFALSLNYLWQKLGRKLSDDVALHPHRYSILPMAHPFVVPGGRFREFYYWDTYWIVKGLLVSNMKETTKNVLSNMLDMVDKFGFFPNGARVYYLNRSQPPLLSEMVLAYYSATGDVAFLNRAVRALDREYAFWMKEGEHAIQLPGGHVLNRYYTNINYPRPESWREDTADAEGMSQEDKFKLWSNIAAAAESGHDFSSRWMAGTTLNTTVTTSILPVDLNSILFKFEQNMAYFYIVLGKSAPVNYELAQAKRLTAIEKYLWDEVQYKWFDYSLTTNSQLKGTYPSNYHPLWSGAFNTKTINAQKIVTGMLSSGLIQDGGILTTLVNTGQQWDAPNAWAPLQSFWIGGLNNLQRVHEERSGNDSQMEPMLPGALAKQLAQTWIHANHLGYVKYGQMMEKYDAFKPGEPGSGGEYVMPIGFGWTNGVALELLNKYPDLHA